MSRRHPIGLYILFLVEMWERFGFYCMLAIFKLYMIDKNNGQPFLQENSNQIYGLYLGGVYFTPFFGGILAEWKMGYRLTIIVGAILMAAGYFLLGAVGLPFFVAGLGLIIIGNGLFKPNISSMVGKLYQAGDPRVDSAFTIFYMGINVGAFTSPFVASYLEDRFGFHTAFAAAGVGMIISLVLFLFCQRWVVENRPPAESAHTDVTAAEIDAKLQGRRNLALALFFGINVLFWMAFKQNGNSFAVWFLNHTDRQPPESMANVLQQTGLARFLLNKDGNEFLKALQAAINPFYVIVLSPVLVIVWQRLRARGLEPSTPAKLVVGFFLTAVAFVFMAIAGMLGGDTGRVSMRYLLGGYAILTTAELCLSPMGLSLVSKLAHPKTRAIWMGGFFVSTAIGGYLSGAVGYFWEIWPHSRFFLLLAGSSLFAMLLMLASYRVIASAMPAKK
jgi:proton-dependent oligopeptide transporter, POT family